MLRILIAGIPGKCHNYVEAVSAAGMEAQVSLELPKDLSFPQYDGLLLPGGSDINPARYRQPLCGSRDIDEELDAAQFALLEAFLKTGKPILGICKGHQVINVWFGGSLIQDIPQAGRHRYAETDQIHMTHAERGNWLYDLYGSDFPTNSAHHQAVDRLGDGFRVIQTSDDGVIEAMAHDSLPILSVQWHPERMCGRRRRADTVDGAQVFSYFKTLCETYSHASPSYYA